jgi:hypothetical protein
MILTARLLPKEAKALTEMCRRFRYPDAQHLLTGNVTPTNLCDALTCVLNDSSLGSACFRRDRSSPPQPAPRVAVMVARAALAARSPASNAVSSACPPVSSGRRDRCRHR